MYVADTRVTVISVTYQRYTFSSTDTVGDDCPIFDGLFDYCAISAGGSMGALQLSMWLGDAIDDHIRGCRTSQSR
jgi:hypothetical protein